MTVTREQIELALSDLEIHGDYIDDEVYETIRTVLQECLDMVNGFSEGELRTMMRDPKYWRDKDPDMIEQVRKGWEIVFGKPSQPSEALDALDELMKSFNWHTGYTNEDRIELSQIIRTALQRKDVPQWQPIETAPKDGEWCLLHYHHDHVPLISFWSVDEGIWARPCPRSDSQFTHWMPLPAAPKAGE